jgi:hypothetical protein
VNEHPLSDGVTSWLRTVIPGLWAAIVTTVVTWLGTNAPWAIDLMATLGVDLESPTTTAFIVSLTLAGWYALFRKIEPHLPPWLTRIVLGSNSQPHYDLTA